MLTDSVQSFVDGVSRKADKLTSLAGFLTTLAITIIHLIAFPLAAAALAVVLPVLVVLGLAAAVSAKTPSICVKQLLTTGAPGPG